MEQISGQVYYLSKYYNNQISQYKLTNVLEISYSELCKNPIQVLEQIQIFYGKLFNKKLNLITQPPVKFEFGKYKDHPAETAKFKSLIEKFEIREQSRKPINRFIANEAICQGCGAYVENVRKFKGNLFCEMCAAEQLVH